MSGGLHKRLLLNVQNMAIPQHAFSLLEMAMVLAFSGLVAGFAMNTMKTTARNCNEITQAQLRDIDSALAQYAKNNDSYPRPALRAVGMNDVRYGRATSSADIYDASPQSNGTQGADASAVLMGALPFQTLGLAASYGADCWGNKFTYAVTRALTDKTNYLQTDANYINGVITIKSAANTALNSKIAYVVISHGADSFGAVHQNYGVTNTDLDATHSGALDTKKWCAHSSALESENCDVTNTVFVAATANDGASAGAAKFDDLVIFKGRDSFNALATHPSYYVDPVLGNDANTGTSPTTPWKTVAKVNAKAFAPGDWILFKKGGVWREQLTVSRSGTADKPIVYGSYGTDPTITTPPEISGADQVDPTRWTPYSANVYVATIGSMTPPNQLYVDDVYYDVAHYPNNGYLRATGTSSAMNTIIDSTMTLGGDYLAGATLVAQPRRWTWSAVPLTGFSTYTHTITVGSNFIYPMTPGYGYYLRNKLWMLDAPKEWFYDQTTGKLYIYMAAGDTPARHKIVYSKRDYAIYSGLKNYVTIQGIKASYAQGNTIQVDNTTTVGFLFDQMTVLGGNRGMQVSCASCRVQNSAFQGALVNSIYANGSNVSLIGNLVSNTANIPLTPDKTTPHAIVMNGSYMLARGNTVTNSAAVGIAFFGNHHLVQNNIVDRSCLKLNDCAGIYTWSPSTTNTDIANVVDGNKVSNSIGNSDGAPSVTDQAEGIYLDDMHQGVTVKDNIIRNVGAGIFIHNGHNDVITNNEVYGARDTGLRVQEDNNGAPGYNRDNLVTDNYFHSLKNGQAFRNFTTIPTTGTRLDFGTFNNNLYCSNAAIAVYVWTAVAQDKKYTLPNWQTMTGQDAHSQVLSPGCKTN